MDAIGIWCNGRTSDFGSEGRFSTNLIPTK